MDIHAAGDEADLASAARQAGWQSGLLAAVGLLNVGREPSRLGLVVLVVAFAAIAVALCLTPARVWGPRSIIALTIVLFVCLGDQRGTASGSHVTARKATIRPHL